MKKEKKKISPYDLDAIGKEMEKLKKPKKIKRSLNPYNAGS